MLVNRLQFLNGYAFSASSSVLPSLRGFRRLTVHIGFVPIGTSQICCVYQSVDHSYRIQRKAWGTCNKRTHYKKMTTGQTAKFIRADRTATGHTAAVRCIQTLRYKAAGPFKCRPCSVSYGQLRQPPRAAAVGYSGRSMRPAKTEAKAKAPSFEGAFCYLNSRMSF